MPDRSPQRDAVVDQLVPTQTNSCFPNVPDCEIIRVLGQGGMGQVYLAHQPKLSRQVTVKVIQARHAAKPELKNRFMQEARTLGRLEHDHIVRAYHVDETPAGEPYLIMEYLGGESLDHCVPRGGLHIAQACDYVRQAALGLQFAHERGCVHRDIKPSNLMRVPQRESGHRIKLLDLGLGRILDDAHGTPVEQVTQQTDTMGTPAFMAPEQWDGLRQADIRSDLYSLGCTLFYLLTRKTPFGGLMDLRNAHKHAPPPSLRDLRPEVPVEVDSIYQKLLAKEPRDRFQTPAELAQALAPWSSPAQNTTSPLAAAGPLSTTTPLDTWRKRFWNRRRATWAAVAASVIVAGLLIWALFFRDSQEGHGNLKNGDLEGSLSKEKAADEKPGPGVAARDPVVYRKDCSGPLTCLLVSPDGTSLVTGSVDSKVTLRNAADGSEVLTQEKRYSGHSLESIRSLAFGPDPQKILIASNALFYGLHVWDSKAKHIDGKSPIANLFPRSMATSEDGRRMAVAYSDQTVVLDPRWERVATVPAGAEVLAISQSGGRLMTGNGEGRVQVWELNGTKAPIFEVAPAKGEAMSNRACRIALSREGDRALISRKERGFQVWDVDKEEKLQNLPGHDEELLCLAISADGTQALTGGRDTLVRLWDLKKGAELAVYKGHADDVTAVAFSPDGARGYSISQDKTLRCWDLSVRKAMAKGKERP